MISRGLYIRIWERLSKEKSMVFLAGPRQVGKTTLARIISRTFRNRSYFNYDIPEHRKRLIEDPVFFEAMERKDPGTPLIIFDEIHKYRDWKNYLKGVHDAFHDSYRFLVSGSGRLDIYRKGGDSLAGRYFLFHLWPFTVAELGGKNRSFREFIKNPLYITMEGSSKLKRI
jgi:predicted AAA+ superfamily ATPase